MLPRHYGATDAIGGQQSTKNKISGLNKKGAYITYKHIKVKREEENVFFGGGFRVVHSE